MVHFVKPYGSPYWNVTSFGTFSLCVCCLINHLSSAIWDGACCRWFDVNMLNCKSYTFFMPLAYFYMSHDMTKPTKWLCAQRRLRSAWTSAQSDQSLRCALNVQLRTRAFLMWTGKTGQTGRMPRLIWVFAWRTLILFVLSYRGSYKKICLRRFDKTGLLSYIR